MPSVGSGICKYSVKIIEVIDPTPEYRRRKGELERLRASDPLSRKVAWMKSREGDDNRHVDPEYQRKLQYFDKLRKVHIARWRDLTSQVDRLKGEAQHHKYQDQPTGMFVKYDTVPGVESPAYLDEVGLLIHQQNANLDFPADEAITRFVGHAHGFGDAGVAGIWSEGKLEDAYSDNPDEQGQLIRQQLEAGMAPIKQLLRARFGDTIYLYRSQRPLEPGQSHRGVLSWTASQRFATYHGGDTFQKIEKAIPLEDIVWITDRANQQEFICLNRRGAPHYLGMT